jgi:hypothetical protein
VELEIGGKRQRVEVELPVDHPAAQKSRVAFRPRRWKLFASKIAAMNAFVSETSLAGEKRHRYWVYLTFTQDDVERQTSTASLAIATPP